MQGENNKIAIVGMSGRFPGVEDLSDLDYIYSNKIDCVTQFSDKRRDLLNLDEHKTYFEAAYLNDVEFFDYSFFNISKYEASMMDPQQKIILQLACDVIEDAGYSLREFENSNTSLTLGAHNSHFFDDYIGDDSAIAFLGSFLDTLAGRIAYSLNLTGPSSIVQTACSSSLYAIYDACLKLNSGVTDTAIAGGITLEFRARYSNYHEINQLMSPQARCKSFDNEANGINLGEGAGLVLLKRYEDAIRDGDDIYAVILSSAANQDGARSTNITAPSSIAQKEVIKQALKLANITPEDIGYIEAHGTGTKIGDPIEILGITEAFSEFTEKRMFCPIGSLKTNMSHLGSAAGIASVIKGIISFKTEKKYPLANLNKPNLFLIYS